MKKTPNEVGRIVASIYDPLMVASVAATIVVATIALAVIVICGRVN